jgi:mannitol-specific phosphotransferase system IIBC component
MPTIDASHVRKVVVACDAGMGSSVMLASTVRKQLARTSIEVDHTPIDRIPTDADVVLCHAGARRSRSPGRARQSDRADPAVHRRPGGHQGAGGAHRRGTIDG